MAQRRMFSKHITDSDAFTDMPPTSQLLYFYLNMEADDDGFVSNPKKVMKMIGSAEDDYKILIAKRFILTFENGVCVIKHWLIHNLIRNDRYIETKYTDEKNQLEVKENKAYTEIDPHGNQMATIGKPSIGKVSIGKVRLDKDIWGEFENVFLTREELDKLIDRFNVKNTHILIEELSGYIKSKGKDKYKDHYATLQNWGRRRISQHQEKLQAKSKTIA